MARNQILIVGGGIIGLSIARELASRGAGVTVLERGKPGQQASRVAGGMLAASAEVGFEEYDLYRLCSESLRRWPKFAEKLRSETGIDVDYRDEGCLIVAEDRDEAEALKRVYEFQKENRFNVRWLSPDEALDIEPFLGPRIAAAVFAPEDHSVDNRAVMRALAASIRADGGVVREGTEIVSMTSDASGVRAEIRDGDSIEADTAVIAAGPWSAKIDGLSGTARTPVRPVKGQLIELESVAPFELRHVVRRPGAYLVPRTDGRIMVGATSEELGFDRLVTAGGLYSILEKSWEIVPGIYELPVVNTLAGLRPGSRDNQPIVGWTSMENIFVATGHYRHGILLSVVTAQESANMILDGASPELLKPFSPSRFAAAGA